MVTVMVARLAHPLVEDRDAEPKYVSSDDLPENILSFAPGPTGLKGLIKNMEELIGDEIQILVMFPGGWAGKKPPAVLVEERVGNFLTMTQEAAIVVAGATACNFFGPKIYKTYAGTACRDFGTLLFPAPHPEDLLNSTNVTVGDLVIALRKASLANGRVSEANAG